MAGAAESTQAATGGGGRSKLLPAAAGLALLLGGASFYAVWSGLIGLPWTPAAAPPSGQEVDGGAPPALERPGAHVLGGPPAFVEVAPLVISLGPDSGARLLKVRLTLEVDPEQRAEVEHVAPRVADVLNTYLRAVEPSALADPRQMARLRAQMLRRVQLVAPQGSVRDLLVQEFVLN